MSLRNNLKAKVKALFHNEKVGYLLLFLLLGMIIAFDFNAVTPFSLTSMPFLVGIVGLLLFIIYLAFHKCFVFLRIMFLGASITSVLFASRTFFFSIVKLGMVQIPLDAIVGLFRSILFTSIFSLLERLTRFIEDQLEN